MGGAGQNFRQITANSRSPRSQKTSWLHCIPCGRLGSLLASPTMAGLGVPQAYGFVGGKLSAALSSGTAAWQDVELAVSLLYQLGEGAPDDAMKPGEGGSSAP
jgi:hypothetical protein